MTIFIDEPEKLEYRGYEIHLGQVESSFRDSLVWYYEIYVAEEKISYGGNPCSEDREIAIAYAQEWVDEYLHDTDPEPEPYVDDSLPEWANYYPNESDYIAEF